jgi:hypothetical protein
LEERIPEIGRISSTPLSCLVWPWFKGGGQDYCLGRWLRGFFFEEFCDVYELFPDTKQHLNNHNMNHHPHGKMKHHCR